MQKTAKSEQKKGARGGAPIQPKPKSSYRYLIESGRGESALQEIPKKIVLNVLSAVMPLDHAKVLAGYSEKTNASKLRMPECNMTVESIRNKLREVAGVTLADQIAWYLRASGDPENATSEQINARKQVDKLLGYEAPQKVEVSEQRHLLIEAVHTFNSFKRETGMDGRQLKFALRNRCLSGIDGIDGIDDKGGEEISEVNGVEEGDRTGIEQIREA